MMEHVQAGRSKVQHLADVPVKAWRRDKATGLTWTDQVTTLCGRTIGPVGRMLENPNDCTKCRKVASRG